MTRTAAILWFLAVVAVAVGLVVPALRFLVVVGVAAAVVRLETGPMSA
jgi:hypothetical protein